MASSTVPRVASNSRVIHVNPLDETSVAAGLLDALDLGTSDADRRDRRASVADLTWHQAALDHVAGWQ